MFLVLELKLVTERTTEKKKSLTRALVVKYMQHLSFLSLSGDSCLCLQLEMDWKGNFGSPDRERKQGHRLPTGTGLLTQNRVHWHVKGFYF